MADITKASFNLPRVEYDRVKALAARRRASATRVLREAMSTEHTLQDIADRDGRLIIQEPTGELKEVILSQLYLGSCRAPSEAASEAEREGGQG